MVDLVDLGLHQSKLLKIRMCLLGGMREWWLNWLNVGRTHLF